ncbi:MAG: endonuclease [Dictyoglomus sp. NZ13-RE01]|nr:MAG: endonuclease [Dictyoglomus sp. NZ13-RE01]
MKGIYILLINVEKDLKINVGSLGKIDFKKGIYCYVGSAQNNLEKRILRHISKNKRKFWHVDYLLSNRWANVIGVIYIEADKNMECKIARELEKKKDFIPKFGSSDCKCKSHLFRV